MNNGVKMRAASFCAEKISTVEKTCEDCHCISNPKARMKNKVGSHDQCRAQKRNRKSAPKARCESLFQNEPSPQGHPERRRVAQQSRVGCSGIGQRSCP